MVNQYKLTYFPVRGLAEPIRLLLADQGIAFDDVHVTHEEWPKMKSKFQFGQIPCLTDGDMQIVQSGAMIRHLARKHNLYGSTECEHTHADMVYDGIRDLRSKYATMIYREYEKRDEFVKDVAPVELAKFESLLKSKHNGDAFVLGEKLSFVDYALFEELDVMNILDAHLLDAHPTLKAYHKRMHDRKGMQEYLHKRKLPVNGNGKQ